jgi:hypothetical protein
MMKKINVSEIIVRWMFLTIMYMALIPKSLIIYGYCISHE